MGGFGQGRGVAQAGDVALVGRAVDPFLAAQMLHATLNACAELEIWVPGVSQKAAPAVFARPLLMGIFER